MALCLFDASATIMMTQADQCMSVVPQCNDPYISFPEPAAGNFTPEVLPTSPPPPGQDSPIIIDVVPDKNNPGGGKHMSTYGKDIISSFC